MFDPEALARKLGFTPYKSTPRTHPANPATGYEEARKTVQDRAEACRVDPPAPTRQNPAKPGTAPTLAGCLPGVAGSLQGRSPGKSFADKEGQKPTLEGGLPGLPGAYPGVSIRQDPLEVTLIQDPQTAAVEVERLSRCRVLGFDLETTGLDPRADRARLASFATEKGAVVFDLLKLPPVVLRPLFGEEGPVLVGHNLRFDLGFLLALGVWEGSGTRLWDTALTHQVITASSRMPALKDLVAGLDKTLQASDWGGELTEDQLRYAAKDAWAVLSLYREQQREARKLDLLPVVILENTALPAVAWMEVEGVPFDTALWEETAREAERERQRRLEALPFGVNWDSSAQVLRYLRAEGLPIEDTREETLAAYQDRPLVAQLLAFREASRRVSAFGRDWLKWVKGGRVYPSWKQIGAETGRMACARPNLQQVPRDPALRQAFRPGPGRVLVKADYSQIELRLAAAIAKDRRMMEAFT
jgi:DNA polymerase-1